MCSFSDSYIDPNGLRNHWFEICSGSAVVDGHGKDACQ